MDEDARLDDLAQELVEDTQDKYEQTQAAQQEILDDLANESGAMVLETQCTIAGDHTVPLKTKLSGDIMDTMGQMDARLERFETGEARAYEISDTADIIAQMLADIIDDPAWNKETFYGFYEQEGLQGLGVMLERVFDALTTERDRRQGAAEGFRST